MKKLLVILIASLSIFFTINAQINPANQFEKAVGRDYCLVSDDAGRWQMRLCSTIETAGGGGGDGTSAIEITISNGTPTSTPNSTDPKVYLNAVNGDLWTWDATGTEWKQVGKYDFQNGLNLNNGTVELGGQIIKNTIIEDPTDSYEFLFRKGSAEFGFSEDNFGVSQNSFHIKDTDGNGGQAKLSVAGKYFQLKANDDSGNLGQFDLSPDGFYLVRQDDSGATFTMNQLGNSFGFALTQDDRVSDIKFVGTGDVSINTKNGAVQAAIRVSDGIKLRTPSVFDGTAENGMFLKLTNEDFGDSEWSNSLSSDFIQTPLIDFDGDGNSFPNLTGQLQDIKDALGVMGNGTDSDNQELAINGSSLSISNGNSVSLIDFDTDKQNLSLLNGFLGIERGAGVDISGINTDNQNLIFDATSFDLGIAGGNTVNLSALAGGGGGTGTPYVEYEYEIGTPNLNDGAFVIATNQNITWNRSQNVVTVTIPDGTKPKYILVYNNISNFSQEDFTVKLQFEDPDINTAFSKAVIPKMSFIKMYNRTSPNSTQYWNFDDDFPPTTQKQITGLVNGAISCTFKNVQSSGTNTFGALITL